MVSEGEQIAGTLKCAPNVRNNRDLDITIEYILPDGTDKHSIEYKMFVFFLPSIRYLMRSRA
jgi:protein arginine N-methyltransferase 1